VATGTSPADAVPEGDERIAVPIRATGYFRLHMPSALAPGPAPLLLAIHGYRQPPQSMLDYAVSVAPEGAIVLAPEGPSAFYGPRVRERAIGRRVDYGWIADPRRPDSEARNRSLITGAIEHAAGRHALDRERAWLLGFSQGVGVAMDFAVHHRERVAGVVGLAGGVPPHGRPALDRLAGLPLLWVTASKDPDYPPDYEAELLSRLREAGAAVEALELDAGHDVLEPARAAVRSWLAAGRR